MLVLDVGDNKQVPGG